MIIKLSECEATGTGLFRDLAKYKTIDKFLEDIIKGKDSTRPLNCGVRIDEKYLYVKRCGCIEPDAQSTIELVKALPYRFRKIPNDVMEISADSFERELYFKLR